MRGRDIIFDKCERRENACSHSLLIVLNAASGERAVFFHRLPRVSPPQRNFALGHNVQVAHEPHSAIALAPDDGHQIGAHAA